MSVKHAPTGVVHRGDKGEKLGVEQIRRKMPIIGLIHMKRSRVIKMAVKTSVSTN
ncbi:hypothetical protein [Vibrio fluvialis]|jgi:hypothetical protein|uniref:hypothetical protein n=1 Tax=Vibrio fluvialis TaxID=676 RepID=UPI0013923E15|nr:hypothetical protein [Vibrio fluvialis]EKO3420402.1 hypothetical protein [Vibrio fluvialis]EKO3466561.1 hypothetical protein [Vibrio fluvialis]EKO3504725.1 hypothetical protein [Vibrio fluvialis]EKO5148949.1 hypothetical protein [Vibrio fluvialis]ELH7949969.1 hypothetical protein [Vibrio fluvialis]